MVLALGISMEAWPAETAQVPPDDPPMNQNATTVGDTSLLGRDFSLTASFKIWRATSKYTASSIDFDESTANMYGPAVNLTYREKFYGGISYYKGDGFEVTDENGEIAGVPGVSLDITKTDLDLWAGYRFHSRGSAFLGYKNTKLEV
jgi:hypothetical protein